MLTLLAPLLLLQNPLPQIEIRVEKSIESGSPAACCSQSKGQAKGGGTPKKARSLKQAWIEHQKSGKSLGIQETKATAKSLVPLNASFGWTTQPPNHGGNGPIMRGKAIIIDDSGQQRVIEFDGDLPDLQGFLPAGVKLPNFQELIRKGGNFAGPLSCTQSGKGEIKEQGCPFASKGCDKAQGCPVQGGKFGKTHAPHLFQTSGEVLWTPTTRAREELPEEIFEMVHSRGANHEWLHDHDEDEGELEEVLEEAHEALEEAYDRIDELEERLAHMEQVLKHISDELINEDR